VTTIVYLHGFRSSPASIKAMQLRDYVAELPGAAKPRLHIPDLAHRPAAAVAGVAAWVEREADPQALTFIGSSLGGYYATHLAERYGARAVLINPTVRPFEDLQPWRGAQTNLHSGATFEVTQAHFDELLALRASRARNGIGCSWKPATRCSIIAKPSRSTAAHSSMCAAAAITRSRNSRCCCRPSCASPALTSRDDDAAFRGDRRRRRAGLRELGSRLAVLDEGDVAQRAARGNFGLIWVRGKGLGRPHYGTWTQRSVRAWPRFAALLRDETGIDVALRQTGGVHVCLSERELDVRSERFAQLFARPGFERHDVEFLDRAGMAKRLPGIARALCCRRNHAVVADRPAAAASGRGA
jgi:predicted esterase YcpF (UPF0227 family)